MDARIDHVTDSRDTRPAFGITYRRYCDTCTSHVRIQADDVDHAMQALTEYIGNTQYAVISIRQEVPQVPAIAPTETLMTPDRIRTDELTAGTRVVSKDMTRFTVDSVTPAKVDWRFTGRHGDGSTFSDSGMEIVGHDEAGEVIRFTAAQSYLWWRNVEAEKSSDAEGDALTAADPGRTQATRRNAAPTTVARRAIYADGKELTVSTIRIAANRYDTAVFDDSPDKRHVGMSIGGYVIDNSSKSAANREAAMDNHREALIAARHEQPKETR